MSLVDIIDFVPLSIVFTADTIYHSRAQSDSRNTFIIQVSPLCQFAVYRKISSTRAKMKEHSHCNRWCLLSTKFANNLSPSFSHEVFLNPSCLRLHSGNRYHRPLSFLPPLRRQRSPRSVCSPPDTLAPSNTSLARFLTLCPPCGEGKLRNYCLRSAHYLVSQTVCRVKRAHS